MTKPAQIKMLVSIELDQTRTNRERRVAGQLLQIIRQNKNPSLIKIGEDTASVELSRFEAAAVAIATQQSCFAF